MDCFSPLSFTPRCDSILSTSSGCITHFKMEQDTKSRRSSDDTLGANNTNAVPELPKEEVFDDDSKVPFLTARTFFMTVLVSMGGICFG